MNIKPFRADAARASGTQVAAAAFGLRHPIKTGTNDEPVGNSVDKSETRAMHAVVSSSSPMRPLACVATTMAFRMGMCLCNEHRLFHRCSDERDGEPGVRLPFRISLSCETTCDLPPPASNEADAGDRGGQRRAGRGHVEAEVRDVLIGRAPDGGSRREADIG